MRRYHQLWGCMIMSFGFGILVGKWIASPFWCHGLGLVLIFGGILMMRKRPCS